MLICCQLAPTALHCMSRPCRNRQCHLCPTSMVKWFVLGYLTERLLGMYLSDRNWRSNIRHTVDCWVFFNCVIHDVWTDKDTSELGHFENCKQQTVQYTVGYLYNCVIQTWIEADWTDIMELGLNPANCKQGLSESVSSFGIRQHFEMWTRVSMDKKIWDGGTMV